jgi:Tol biopolymer transport system component
MASYVVSIDDSAPPHLVVATRRPGGLSFSPDDTQLVYSAQNPVGLQNDLYIVALAGRPAQVVAPSLGDDIDPAWRPIPAG